MGKVQDSILRVYENMTAVERSIADFFMSNEEPMDFSSRNVAGMLPTGKCILNCRKALAGMIPAGKCILIWLDCRNPEKSPMKCPPNKY